MNRRGFLTSIGVLTTGLGSTTDLLMAANTQTAMSKLKIGFLGVSHTHALDKLKVLHASPDYEVVGFCEPAEALREQWKSLGVVPLQQEELLGRCDVVAVESEVRKHADHALIALKAGKNVHLEKPPATNLADLKEIIDLAQRNDRLVQVGYMWRYHPGFDKVFQAVREGWLGEVFQVRASIGNVLKPERRPEWAEFAGGSFFELGSHLVDAVVRLLGKPTRIVSSLNHHGDFPDRLKDNNIAMLEYKRSLAMIINTALEPNASQHRSFEVLGSNGRAILRPIEPPSLELDLTKPAGSYAAGRQTVPMPTYSRYVADFAALASAIRNKGSLGTTAEMELAVHETLCRASLME